MVLLPFDMKYFKNAAEIRVALVGYGGVGGKRLAVARDAGGMIPVAIVEPDEARREAAEREFPGIEVFATAAEMLKNSDANLVIVVTPHHLHAPLTLQCLKAGRHVICEKPMAITARECDAMIREAKKRRLMLSVHHNRHWDGCILRAVEQIREKKVIGDLVRMDARMGVHAHPGDHWRSSRSMSGGVAYDWGVHLLEFMLQLTEARPVEVSGYSHGGFWAGQTRWGEDGNEDEMRMGLRFDNGLYGSLTLSQLDASPAPGLLEITGTKGSYVIFPEISRLILVQGGQKTEKEERHPPGRFEEYFRNVAGYLTGQETLVITPEWAKRPVELLDLAGKSAAQGRSLRVRC